MEILDVHSPLANAAQEFLESRKHFDNLTKILAGLNDDETTAEAIQIIQTMFMELLRRRSMLSSVTSASDYINKLRESYDAVWNKFGNIMMNDKFCEQVTNALFVLIGQEGKFPIDAVTKNSYYFPEKRLKFILKKCFSTRTNFSGVLNQLDEFTNFIDLAYYFWLNVPSVLQTIPAKSEKSVSHVLDVLQRIPIPSEDELSGVNEELLLCYTKNKAKFKPKYLLIQKSIQNLWSIVSSWNLRNNNHKKVLVFLLESVMPHLLKPTLTMDYLMDSLNSGGSISLLALQGVFVLVKDHNFLWLVKNATLLHFRCLLKEIYPSSLLKLERYIKEMFSPSLPTSSNEVFRNTYIKEYPNIYGKLYSFFHPSIFYTKYKNRLYMLTNIFLSSTHLPEMLIASFIKRFSRLCLQAPPQDILILSAFIGNLLIRHPTLKILIQQPSEKSISADPYIAYEEDPYKTRALESSLWELESLQQHVLPKVSSFVTFINNPLPTTEWDLTSFINLSYDEMFEKESRRKFRKVSLTFEEPKSFELPRSDYFAKLWDVTV